MKKRRTKRRTRKGNTRGEEERGDVARTRKEDKVIKDRWKRGGERRERNEGKEQGMKEEMKRRRRGDEVIRVSGRRKEVQSEGG